MRWAVVTENVVHTSIGFHDDLFLKNHFAVQATGASAVEMAPACAEIAELTQPAYQQNLASGLATAIAAMHNQLGGPP